ncbi:MAG: VOC family protein [Candidatus Kariarchaeaceae archaeon]|jgi:predicted lactoylglutathione lyase
MSDKNDLNLMSVAPYFQVKNINVSTEHYRDKLGFYFERLWGEPPTFAMIQRDSITIMLQEHPMGKLYPDLINPNRKTNHHDWDAYVWVKDLQSLYDDIQKRGGTIISKPMNKDDYGMREFEIQDPDGYVICFGMDIGETD